MTSFTAIFKKTFRYSFLWGVLTSGWAYMSGGIHIGNGMVLGTLASLCCLIHLYYQMKRCAAMSPPMAAAYIQAGWVVRLSAVLVVFVISVLLPQISFIAALAGYFSLQLLWIIGSGVLLIKNG